MQERYKQICTSKIVINLEEYTGQEEKIEIHFSSGQVSLLFTLSNF